jgi:hypothetical protein
MSVVLTASLTVEDPAEFVSDPDSATAVAAGIAEVASVDVSAVSAVLSVASANRRLGSYRRLQGGSVNVEATIQAESANAVADLRESVASIPVANMAVALNSALEAAGMEVTVVVSSMVAAEGLPVDLPNTPPSGMAMARTKTSRGADTADIADGDEITPASADRRASTTPTPDLNFSTTSMLGSLVALVLWSNFIFLI